MSNGTPPAPGFWDQAKALVKGSLGYDYPSQDELAKQVALDAQTDPAAVRARAKAGEPQPAQGELLAAREPDLRGTVAPPAPGFAAEGQWNDEFSNAQQSRESATQDAFRRKLPGPTGVIAGAVMPEGSNYLPVESKSLFQETYEGRPARLGDAQLRLGDLEAQKSEELSKVYGQQAEQATSAMAASKVRRAADDQEIQRRQGELDKNITAYTNDLHDQNKFWSSPGNILSAITFSLLPIVSNDPAIGIKLINQAIDRDMSNRKDLANMHLGELRSNLGGYRKMVEDRNVGDQLAQAEAHRIAAMDIERISQQFNSPISKTKATAMYEDQMMRAGQAKMGAYKHDVYNQARIMDARLAAAYKSPQANGNTDGWKAYDGPDGARNPKVAGIINGSPSVASGTKTSFSPVQRAALLQTPSVVSQLAIKDRIPRNELMELFKDGIDMRARGAAAGHQPGSPAWYKSYNDELSKQQDAADAGVAEIAKAAQPIVGGIGMTARISRDMALLEAEMRQGNPNYNMNNFVGDMRAVTGGPLAARIRDLQNRFEAGDGKAGQQAHALRNASERFHQAIAGQIVVYYHDLAGAAQNEAEIANLKSVITHESSWEKIRGFVDLQSKDYKTRMEGAYGESKSPFGAQLYKIQYGGRLASDSKLPYAGRAEPVTREPTNVARGDTTAPASPLSDKQRADRKALGIPDVQ